MPPNEPPITPPAQDPPTPPADDTPAWAKQLIDQNADLSSRIDAFEDKITLPPPDPDNQPAPTPPPEPETWQPKSWDDVANRIDETAEQKAQRIVDDRDKATKERQEAATAASQEADQYIDAQVDELTKDNKLPAITNESDPNDPGKLAQRELYGYALSLGTADLKTAFNSLDALHTAGKSFDFVKMELVDKNPAAAGANSPVGSSNAGASGTSTRPDYKMLHNSSLDSLAARFSQ